METREQNEQKVPEHAARIETISQIVARAMQSGIGTITIDRDQIRRALGLALVGEQEMPRECLARVREVLDKIGGPL